MTIGSGRSAGTLGTYAGLALGLIRYKIHHCRGELCIHTPAALRLGTSSFGYFHCTNIRLVTDRASGRVNGVHKA